MTSRFSQRRRSIRVLAIRSRRWSRRSPPSANARWPGCWASKVSPRTPQVRVRGPNNGPADLPAQGLAGSQARRGHAPPHPSHPFRRHGTEPMPPLGRFALQIACRATRLLTWPASGPDGWMGLAGVRRENDPPDRFLVLVTDRRPQLRASRLASVALGQGH
jgi:hypothetical protein